MTIKPLSFITQNTHILFNNSHYYGSQISISYSMFQITQDDTLNILGREVPMTDILHRLIQFKDPQNTKLIAKFNLEHIISLIDKNKICEIEKIYHSAPEGFNVFDFTRFFLNIIEHKQQQTLYLTMSIVDLFKEISFFNDVTERVRFSHITNYICKGILSERDNQYQIKARLLPHERKLIPSECIREGEVFAPVVYGKTGQNPIKLSRAKLRADRTKHTGIISEAFYSHTKKNIFCLDSLSQSIGRYDINAQLIGKITPTSSKIKRDAIILSFAYSERQQRIGALLKNLELIFWDIEDNFGLQKSFSTARFSPEQQINIWFLQYHNQWATSDSTGGLNFWNLQAEGIYQSVKIKNKITQICEIRCLNLIAIAQEKPEGRKQECESKITLYNLVKNSIVIEIQLGIQSIKHRALNSLQYSNTYQILLYADSSKQITLLEINPTFFDATVKGKLIGHQYIITSFILVKKTPTVVSCDDKQKIKVWDLRNCSCVQTLDFEGKTVINRLLSLARINKFAIAGGRLYVVDIQKREEGSLQKILDRSSVHPMSAYYEASNKELLIFTKKDLRFYNLQTGKVNKIYTGYINQDEQVTSLKYLSSCRMFVIGNHQGVMRMHSKTSGNLNKMLLPHEREITSISYDSLNHLYVSSSYDSNILIQKQREHRGKFQLIRSIKDNFFKKQVNLCELSVYHNFIAIGNFQQKMVYIWDYQFCKLLGQIHLKNKAEPTVMCFMNGYSILIIGDNQSQVSAIELLRPDSYTFKMKHLWTYQLSDIPTHFLLYLNTPNQTNMASNCKLIIGVKKGMVYQLDISSIIENRHFQKHISNRLNYNPQRQLNQSFLSEYGKRLFKIIRVDNQDPTETVQQHKITSFQAHQDDITSLIVLNLKDKCFCTCSHDKRIKIWGNQGQLKCDVNVNLSLPFTWKIQISNQELLKGRIMFALKILEIIVLRNKSSISLSEWNMLKINNFFKNLISSDQDFITQLSDHNDEIKMFGEEFGKSDLDFQRSKKYHFKQVGGPRLKQLQAKKRTRSIQKNLKLNVQKAEQQKLKIIQELRIKKNKLQQKEQLIQMFKNPNEHRNSMLKLQNKDLFMKLQKLLNKPQMEEEIKQNIFRNFSKDKTQIRINRQRARNNSRKQISFQEYYQKSRRGIQTSNSSVHFPSTNAYNTQSKWNKSNFRQVLHDLNDKVRWKRLLHTRSHDRGLKSRFTYKDQVFQ